MHNAKGKILYEVWKAFIPKEIAEATGMRDTRALVNLASNEYFKLISH